MKFHLAINLERADDTTDITAVADHTLEMVKMADRAGFDIVWAAEHHALEMTIAPNPFQILMWWAQHTNHIRLGCGVVNAAYWHPIRLAGEAALLDVVSGGRLDFGIGSGAYQREFDRMKPGLQQPESWRYMQEMLPAVQALWNGDYEHDGDYWQFPRSTSCPKPVQAEVPIWVAARSPITFDYAAKNNCNILSWPLTMPASEVEAYRERLDTSIAAHNPDYSATWAVMRHCAVYDTDADRQAALDAVRVLLGKFGNLMTKTGDVVNGFPDEVPLDSLKGNVRVDPDMLETNLMFGSPDQVIEKLRAYENAGVDAFVYYASLGLDMDRQKRSLQMFCDRVLPAFEEGKLAHAG
jgi:alkanesulfonate monooxygenase SsuD/methylene tetrahydromethanopterin reductase-like flavin-dependent oxidoreductase (luciferase family)